MGLFSARPVKQAGKNTIQQKRANGQSYKKQMAKNAARQRARGEKRKGW